MRRTCDTRDSLFSAKIGDMDKGVIERSIDVGNAENILSLSDLGAKLNGGIFLGGFSFLWWLSSKHTSLNPSKIGSFDKR